jgi:hypothetical protein
MGLAMFKRRTAQRHIVSPAAAAYAPMMLSQAGAKKLENVIDTNNKIGKPTRPTRPARAATRREPSHV